MFSWLKRTLNLENTVHEKIKALCAEGDEFAERNAFPEALDKYCQAWDLLPEPKERWEAATWILAAMGDANFLSGDFVAGRDNLSLAMTCLGAIGNPFLHLRLGQCHFELNDKDAAADELIRAYMAAGMHIFSDADPKYFELVTTKAEAPPGGW